MFDHRPLKQQLIIVVVISQILLLGAALALERENFILTAALVCMSVSTGVIRTFYPIIKHTVISNAIDETDVVALAAVLKSVGLAILAAWIVGSKVVYGEIAPVKSSLLLAYVLGTSSLGGIFYMASEGAIKGHIPREEWVRSGKWFAVGVLLSGAFLLWISRVAHS